MHIFLVFLTSLIVVCLASAPKVAAAAGAKTPIKIVAMELNPAPDPTTSYHDLAKEMGLFQKYGLDAEIKAAGGGGPAKVQIIVAGEAAVAVSDIIAAFSAVFESTDVRVLFVPSARYGSPIYGLKKYRKLEDAKGKQWGIASLGGSQRFYSILTVRAMGLSEKDFKWQAVGGSATAVPALLNRRVDLVTITPTAAPRLMKQEGAENVHALVENTAEYTPPFPNFVLIARNKWVKENPEAAERYVEMMLDASRQWSKKAEAWVEPSSRIFNVLTKDELREVYGTLTKGGFWAENGGINYAAAQKVLDLFFEIRGDKPNQHLSKAADVFNTGPLKKVLDRVGVIKGSRDEPDWYRP